MRKRWTAKTEITDSLLKFREKRKWQIALRRYVLEKNKSSSYARYFGLDIEKFRNWIELQFDETINWENFSSAWQFEHIVPISYFDFSREEELLLCWNFINIRVEKLEETTTLHPLVDAIAAKAYFSKVYAATGYPVCRQMIEKITALETNQLAANTILETFLANNKTYLDAASAFSDHEFSRLNEGMPLKEVLAEKELLKKFGG